MCSQFFFFFLHLSSTSLTLPLSLSQPAQPTPLTLSKTPAIYKRKGNLSLASWLFVSDFGFMASEERQLDFSVRNPGNQFKLRVVCHFQ